ncbi:hypothetical protein BDW75DRAFT_10239 [Aspergillus navahoensis]
MNLLFSLFLCSNLLEFVYLMRCVIRGKMAEYIGRHIKSTDRTFSEAKRQEKEKHKNAVIHPSNHKIYHPRRANQHDMRVQRNNVSKPDSSG